MALAKSSMILFLTMVLMIGVCFGAVYKVGDDKGWRYKDFNYQDWRRDKNFMVGDSLLFRYKGKDSVVQVDRTHYFDCNSTDAIAVYDSGQDSITLDKPGHYYYITGYKKHCVKGQRLDIRVKAPIIPSPSPSPSPNAAPHKSAAPSIQTSAPLPLMMSLVLAILFYIIKIAA